MDLFSSSGDTNNAPGGEAKVQVLDDETVGGAHSSVELLEWWSMSLSCWDIDGINQPTSMLGVYEMVDGEGVDVKDVIKVAD